MSNEQLSQMMDNVWRTCSSCGVGTVTSGPPRQPSQNQPNQPNPPPGGGNLGTGNQRPTTPLATQLGRVLTRYIFPTVILASIIWAVFMGIQFGTATDEGKRKQVKDRFIKALATVVIIVVLYGIMIGVVPALIGD